MRTLLKVSAFGLFVVAFFAGFANFGVPRIEPAPPPKDEVIDVGAMTMDEFVALGARTFAGKGTCTLCHNAVGGRAPMLDDLGSLASGRLADPAYAGEATDLESYLHESMVAPSAYVVSGFGKAGSGDSISPMPDVRAGGIGLTEAEMRAVIAYLQDASGLDVTVNIPAEVEDQVDEPPEAAARSPLATAEEIIAEFACGACHRVAGEEGELGPDLTEIGLEKSRDFLRTAILDPDADVADGFEPEMMPTDYGEQLYATELEMLIDYLAAAQPGDRP